MTDIVLDILALTLRCTADLVLLSFSLLVRLPWALTFRSAGKRKKFTSVLITGASVGLGAALAKGFAAPGVCMTITARKLESLEETRGECEDRGAICACEAVDVDDEDGMRAVVERANGRKRLDLVVANAGITPIEDGLRESQKVLKTNVLGMANTVVPAVECMLREKEWAGKKYSPQIVLMSSLGGLAGTPTLYMMPYHASKFVSEFSFTLLRPA